MLGAIITAIVWYPVFFLLGLDPFWSGDYSANRLNLPFSDGLLFVLPWLTLLGVLRHCCFTTLHLAYQNKIRLTHS